MHGGGGGHGPTGPLLNLNSSNKTSPIALLVGTQRIGFWNGLDLLAKSKKSEQISICMVFTGNYSPKFITHPFVLNFVQFKT